MLLQLASIFQHDLCTIPASLIDENGCLRKGNKSILANRLGLKQVSVPAPDIVIVDMQQILCHIVWPHGGDASDLSEHMKRRLSCNCASTEQVLVFDRCDDLSAKDHERMRHDMLMRFHRLQPDHEQSITQTRCYSQEQAQQVGAVMSAVFIQPRGLDVTLGSRDDGAFTHNEADVSLQAKAAELGKDISRILSGDTDVSVMLVYWVWKM